MGWLRISEPMTVVTYLGPFCLRGTTKGGVSIMRTLKKSLALVLALVMVLGLGVVGASADNALDNYTDTGDIGDAYLEAVGVLTGLGIVDGMTDTTIEPDGTYTRAQAAKIVATMLLGVDAADSLKATTAPFEDVPTYHWASGYIAYCVEAGIIDGMTATTFEPEGTLTGFQWAKMLLSAVGFGVNGEFEGDSWSLNTATVGHQSGLFTGDLDGADHVALRREQAMLYAFNALTKLPQVTYSKENTNYLYGILGYFFADGTGHTLGDDTFDLTFVEGQIIDNEGMGGDNTVVANAAYTGKWGTPAKEISIKADTGLDLMYHAVRAWYVEGKTNTGVYTYDLAKTTTYTCLNKATGDKDVAKLKNVENQNIGDLVDEIYEVYLIDNTAIDLQNGKDYAYVTLTADFGKLGYAGKNNTTVNGYTVDNDVIKTDISEIAYGDSIVYVKTHSEKNSNNVAWYVYPVTTTEGAIAKISKTDGKIVSLTLEDGTVLPVSVFFYDEQGYEDSYVLHQNYTFVLDTHGDVIYATKDYSRDLYYYTGESRNAGDYGDWSSDYVRAYRFFNVTTGEEYIVPIDIAHSNSLVEGGYYDIRVTANDNGLYTATRVTSGQNAYAEQYVIDTFWAYEGETSAVANGTNLKDNTVYFDLDTITFHVVSGSGKNMVRNTYTGIDELAAKYSLATNGYYWLENACFTVSGTMTGHKYANVVFLAEKNLTSYSQYAFVPTDVDANDWSDITGDGVTYLVSYDGAYIDGVKTTVNFDIRYLNTDGNALERGFYTVVTRNGETWLSGRVEDGKYCGYNNVSFIQTGSGAGANWTLDGHKAVDGEVKIVDCTNENNEFSLATLYQYCKNEGGNVKLAYTLNRVTGDVAYIYVVNAGWRNSVTLTSDLKDWTIVDGTVNDVDPSGQVKVQFTVKYNGDHVYNEGDQLYFMIDGTYRAGAVAGKNNVFTIYVENINDLDWTKADLKLTAAQVEVKFAVDGKDANEAFAGYKWNAENSYTVDSTPKYVAVGSSVAATFGYNQEATTTGNTEVGMLVNSTVWTGTLACSNGDLTGTFGPVYANTTYTFCALNDNGAA